LNSLESVLHNSLPLKDIAKNIFVEFDGIFSNCFQSSDGVVVRGIPRMVNKIHVIFVINPSCFKTERPRSSSQREATKTEEKRIVIRV
jgi:cytochrome c-type biogenesis protein CcmE